MFICRPDYPWKGCEGRVEMRYMGNIIDLRKGDCEDGWWIELAQNRIQWQDLVLAVTISGFYFQKLGC
jgi:hypothetical protein